MKPFLLTLLVLASFSGARQAQTFTGVITDDMCAKGDHAPMRMGPTAADCTVACVLAHDARYVLFDGSETYALSDQKTPEAFAGQRVRVAGTLDPSTKTIHANSIAAAR